MSSIIPGYEYDIFISYRHKDNRTAWVSEFVANLTNEIESTFKETISIYFDTNPHVGLHDTHDVDGSLKMKLKSLIFIPIVSHTYCDPESFAWEKEFRVFLENVRMDGKGLDVTLPDGNVSKRVLPILIHEIEDHDIRMFENELGSVLRPVKFIYQEAGVNRPLLPNDDRTTNIHGISYRNQLNKIANYARAVIHGMTSAVEYQQASPTATPPLHVPEKKKSIVVLPFTNMSNDMEQEYFSDGLTEEVISDLSGINDLTVISRSSCMTYKGSNKKISVIASELGVGYVLEGSVRKSENKLRISAKLIDPVSDSYLWSEKYNVVLEDIFEIQEKLSRAIVEALKVNLSESEDRNLAANEFDNIEAYDLFLKARNELYSFDSSRMERALILIDKSLQITGDHAALFALKAYTYYNLANMGISYENNLNETRKWLNRSFELDPDCLNAHITMGLLACADSNIEEALDHLSKVLKINPNHFEALFWSYAIYTLNGKNELVEDTLRQMENCEPLSPLVKQMLPGIKRFWSGRVKESVPFFKEGQAKEPGGFYDLLYPLSLVISENVIPSDVREAPTDQRSFFTTMYHVLDLLYNGKVEEANELMTTDLCDFIKSDFSYAHLQALIFAVNNMKEKTLEWLTYAVDMGFCNYPLMNSPKDPINRLLKDTIEYQDLLDRAKQRWKAL